MIGYDHKGSWKLVTKEIKFTQPPPKLGGNTHTLFSSSYIHIHPLHLYFIINIYMIYIIAMSC